LSVLSVLFAYVSERLGTHRPFIPGLDTRSGCWTRAEVAQRGHGCPFPKPDANWRLGRDQPSLCI